MGYRDEYFDNTPSNYGWYKCSRCQKKFRKKDIDVDHIIPRKFKGSNKLYNLQAMCKHCNRSKGASIKNTPVDLVKNLVNRTKFKIKSKKRAS